MGMIRALGGAAAVAAASGGGGPPDGGGGGGGGDGKPAETPEQRAERILAETNQAYAEAERKDQIAREKDPEYDRRVREQMREQRELQRRARNAW